MDNNVTLTPPWYTLRNELLYTFGNNPLITVKPLTVASSNNISNTVYNVEIIVKEQDDHISSALRQIIKPIFNFGTINVRTIIKNSNNSIQKVIDKEYTPTEVADLFCASLINNCLFKGVVIKNNILFVIFNKSIIQFFNDDTTDLCQNYNQIASVIFKKLSINQFNSNIIVNFNTCSEKCINKNKFYCSRINF